MYYMTRQRHGQNRQDKDKTQDETEEIKRADKQQNCTLIRDHVWMRGGYNPTIQPIDLSKGN